MQNSGVFCWGLPEKLEAYRAGNLHSHVAQNSIINFENYAHSFTATFFIFVDSEHIEWRVS